MLVADKPPLEEVYLAHFGIKGMKWGVRKQQDAGSGQQHHGLSEGQHKAVKAAAIAGGVALAAVLLHKGNVKIFDARSAKIYMSGAKMSGRILGKTGSTLIKTSAKLSTTVGKTSAKGAVKVGGLIGKGAYKGAVAGSKATAISAAKAGTKAFESLRRSGAASVRVGSHAMYKLTGRGTPIVNDAVKSRAALHPIDLLLNTRADKIRGT